MTLEEFKVTFDIIATSKIPDEKEKALVLVYCLTQIPRIIKLKEVYELSRIIDEGIEAVRKGNIEVIEIVEAILHNPIITLKIRIPGNVYNEDLEQRLAEVFEGIPDLLFNYFRERGIDLIAFAELFFSDDKDELSRFERIMRNVDLDGTEKE